MDLGDPAAPQVVGDLHADWPAGDCVVAGPAYAYVVGWNSEVRGIDMTDDVAGLLVLRPVWP